MFKHLVLKKLKRLFKLVNQILEKENEMSAELDALTEEVTELGTVIDSAVALLNGLSEQLRLIADDPEKILALANELEAKEQELAAAVVANTPVPPEA